MIATAATYQGTLTMADIEYFYSAHSAFAYFGSTRWQLLDIDSGGFQTGACSYDHISLE